MRLPVVAWIALAYPTGRLRGWLDRTVVAAAVGASLITILAAGPFALPEATILQIGWIFFGWGLLLAFTSVFVAPVLQRWFGSVPSVIRCWSCSPLDLAMIALFTSDVPVVVAGIVLSGAFIGINNTLITEIVMGAAPVERPVASAAYSFLRFAAEPWARTSPSSSARTSTCTRPSGSAPAPWRWAW